MMVSLMVTMAYVALSSERHPAPVISVAPLKTGNASSLNPIHHAFPVPSIHKACGRCMGAYPPYFGRPIVAAVVRYVTAHTVLANGSRHNRIRDLVTHGQMMMRWRHPL